MKELVERVLANEGRLKSRLRELVEVESPSEDKKAVDQAGNLVVRWAEELGGKVKRHKQKAFGDVLEVRFGSTKSGSGRGRVLLLGHLDTVWPIGTLGKMPWCEKVVQSAWYEQRGSTRGLFPEDIRRQAGGRASWPGLVSDLRRWRAARRWRALAGPPAPGRSGGRPSR